MCNVRIIERFEKNEIFLPPNPSSFYLTPGNGAGKFSSLLDHNIFFSSIHFDFEIFTFCGEMGILQANFAMFRWNMRKTVISTISGVSSA